VAIGGITLAKAPAVIAAGADAVCAIAAVVTRPAVKAEIDKFQKLFGGNPSIF
jgi:thiamine monophosphate synthase